MKTPYLQIETRQITQDEHDQLNSRYAQQQDLLDRLRLIWDHNAAILKAHGYRVPSDWTGTPTTQVVVEPEADEAMRIIAACCDVWKAIRSKDLFAIANAGIWLGMMLSGEDFRQYQGRNSRQPRSESKRLAREIYFSRDNWRRYIDFENALEKEGIKATEPQARNWYSDFRKEKNTGMFST